MSILMLFGWISIVAIVTVVIQQRWPLYVKELSIVDYCYMASCSVITSVVTGWMAYTRHPIAWTILSLINASAAGCLSIVLVHGFQSFRPDTIWHFEMIYKLSQ